MHKAVIISGFLFDLSDNIIPFLDKNTDLYVHTWNTKDNSRWITKLNRYKKYCKKLQIVVENPIEEEKLISYFYSTAKAYSIVQGEYDLIIKFKPNIDTDSIPFKGAIEEYYTKAKVQSRPLLNTKSIDDCIFGRVYYKTLDERIFSGTKLAFDRIFSIFNIDDVSNLNTELKTNIQENYEGSIFWTEWINRAGVEIILDTDLIIANNK